MQFTSTSAAPSMGALPNTSMQLPKFSEITPCLMNHRWFGLP
jgi:hypothetical protein